MYEILELLLLASLHYVFATILLLIGCLDYIYARYFLIIHVLLHYSLKYRYFFGFKSHMACNRVLTLRLEKKEKSWCVVSMHLMLP